jgi:acetyltransferase-like isoleucine patch superfamily enzyme
MIKYLRNFIEKLASKFWDHAFEQNQKRFYGRPYFYGPRERITIGKRVSLVNTLLNARSGRIVIGDYVTFGHNVSLLTGIHDYHQKSPNRKTIVDAERDIIIDRGAWICSNAIVVGPVCIGAESVVAAGSVVVENVPKHAIVAGNPARVIRMLEFKE